MPPAFNLSQDQTLQFDSVCLITLAGIESHLDVAIGMFPSSSLREHLWFELAGTLVVRPWNRGSLRSFTRRLRRH
jgi:hypothetical protein